MARISPLLLVPPVAFAALAGLFAAGLMRDNPDDLPSALIGREAPGVPPEGLPGKPALADADLRVGEITIVNYWASWCPPCRAEHPTLMALAAEGYRVAGINFRDDSVKALRYLAEESDPFLAHGYDPSGRVSIDWGVTAPPETFIIAGDGTVLYRLAGPLVGSAYEQGFLPALREATGGD
jgi:cytochrome c biogenesis protein CcmG/thiol:disulfide interchange protein DsbE